MLVMIVSTTGRQLQEIVKNYEIKDIFNFDETALLYKLLPKKSYLERNANKFGSKKFKQRVTLGLCCSAIGEKLKPLLIGTARRPRCFVTMKGSINSLGIHYYHNSNAWMTQTIFNDWVKIIDKTFRLQNRKVLLFVDNFSAHKTPENLTNIEIIYYPSNSTSRLQPLDQGVIRAFKSKFRNLLTNFLSSKLNDLFDKSLNSSQNIFKEEMKSIMKLH
jgi:hypothetical protein